MFQEDRQLRKLRSGSCIFDPAKACSHCFRCIGLIDQKKPAELSAVETARLLEYKIYQLNFSSFSKKLSENFLKNGGYEEIRCSINCDTDQIFSVTVTACNEKRGTETPVEYLGKGMRSIYMLSLLETYVAEPDRIPSIILVEDPEIFLHPQLQKMCCEILYRLSLKNQVIFQTHSPDLLFNFTARQIRQVVLDDDMYSVIREKTNLGRILDDLGYGASDLMNVSFVFIVEGKQDKSRLPLLLENYYSEIRDQFLMIRDGDGKDPEELAGQLCRYYDARNAEDVDRLPRVTRRNVLILKYYSFENYFFNPEIMAQMGIVESGEAFYEILYKKWREYLHRLTSGQKLIRALGRDFTSPEDMKDHMEEIRIHLRGHNLYDIFYGPFRSREQEILKAYIRLAPRDDFKDILDAIDSFPYFDSRKSGKQH